MAWRPTQYLIEGELDNTQPNKVTGWMRFAGIKDKVTFDLEGNFHRDIRGAKIRFTGDAYEDQADIEGEKYFEGFALYQTGKVGDMTAGLPPKDYVDYPYIEWYSQQNGRVVIELEPVQVEVIGKPIPVMESFPVSREEQSHNMAEFLSGLAAELNIPSERAICVGSETVVKANKRVANNKIRGMKLLTDQIRNKLPPLYAQDGKGGKAVVYAKFFTPSSSWTWYVTEGEPVLDESGREVDFRFFGLDLYFQPKTLEEIAPEMFGPEKAKS
jgi:hypothetical protein